MWIFVIQMLSVVRMKSAVTLPRTLPSSFHFFPFISLSLSPISLNLFMYQKLTSNQPELPLHALGLKKFLFFF